MEAKKDSTKSELFPFRAAFPIGQKKTAAAYAGGSESFGVSPFKHGWNEKKVSRKPTSACLFRSRTVGGLTCFASNHQQDL